jgi:hypothetical protein
MTTRAYKFTRTGGIAPFSRFSWPRPDGDRPGDWVDAVVAVPCRAGIHACRPPELPYWVAAELWVIELDGDVVESGGKLVASRGRLLAPVEAWMAGGAAAFGADCARRAAEIAAEFAGGPPELVGLLEGYAADAAHYVAAGDPAVAAHIAATAAGDAAAGSKVHEQDSPAGRAERSRQGAWMVEHLGL